MEDANKPRGRVRFGVFELDLRAGELRKHGLRGRLQEQPFQVLAMLLQHPGEVVSREELQKRLWPADTFVDFDHGLNKAINKIRDALGDSAEAPRFVETVPRRGYRFIAPFSQPPPRVPPAPTQDEKPARRRLFVLAAAATAVIVLLTIIGMKLPALRETLRNRTFSGP